MYDAPTKFSENPSSRQTYWTRQFLSDMRGKLFCHSACLQSEIEESRIEAEGGNIAGSALVGSAVTAFAKETVQAIAPFATFCHTLNIAISLWNLP